MSYFTNDLHHLAARACTGDAGAAVALRRELQPHMLRIVRRALRSTTGASALTERIRAAVDRLSGDVPAHRPTDSARLVRRVAHDICDSLIGRIRAESPDHRPLCETVRN